VFRVDADGAKLLDLTSAIGYEEPGAWLPDGSRIAFTRDLGTFPTEDLHVFLMNTDGSDVRDVGPGFFLSWSPDASRILYGFFGESFSEYWVMNRDGSGAKQLVSRCGECFTPQWTSDGTALLAELPADGGRVDMKTRLAFIGVDGSIQKSLPDTPHGWYEFRLSPDGGSIAYATSAFSENGSVHDGEINVMDADGGHLRRLFSGDQPHALSWSPDSSEIAFSAGTVTPQDAPSPPSTAWDLIVLNVASGEQRVIGGGAVINHVAWSPDGQHIAYDEGRDSGTAAYVIPAAGGNAVSLDQGHDGSRPIWSPDGRQLIFRAGGPGEGGSYALRPDGTVRRLIGLPARLTGGCDRPGQPLVVPSQACRSPDGTMEAGVGQELTITDVASGAQRARLSPDGLQVELSPPAWSPDGSRVAFLAGDATATWLYALNVSTLTVRRLVRADAKAIFTPTIIWSRDGKSIYFTRGGACAGGCIPGYLYRVNADGSNDRQVSDLRVDTLLGFVP
jgi:Tol biopolymer transport system component